MEAILNWALANYTLYMVICCIVLMAIIFVVLQLVKIPLKKLTGKIENESLRKLANKSIILLSFGMSVGLWYLLNYVLPKYFELDTIAIILTGALPIVAYAVGDGVISGGGATKIVGLIKDMVADKKVEKEEIVEINNVVKEETIDTKTKNNVLIFNKNMKPIVKEEKQQIVEEKSTKAKKPKKEKQKSVEDTLNDLLKS